MLVVKPGDVLVLCVAEHLDPAETEALRQAAMDAMPGLAAVHSLWGLFGQTQSFVYRPDAPSRAAELKAEFLRSLEESAGRTVVLPDDLRVVSVLTGTWVGSDGVVHVLHDIGERCAIECKPVTS
jgi:hypothetical protein